MKLGSSMPETVMRPLRPGAIVSDFSDCTATDTLIGPLVPPPFGALAITRVPATTRVETRPSMFLRARTTTDCRGPTRTVATLSPASSTVPNGGNDRALRHRLKVALPVTWRVAE